MSKTQRYLNYDFNVMKPTRNHRPAVWENMLGTVYAMNDRREIEYFDYNWEEALKFAGVTIQSEIDKDRNPRLFKQINRISYGCKDYTKEPRFNQMVLWIK